MFSSLRPFALYILAFAFGFYFLSDDRFKALSDDSVAVISIKADDLGRFILPINVNGFKVSTLVDTGASHIAMSKTLAQQLGVVSQDNPSKQIIYQSGAFQGEAQMLITPTVLVEGRIFRNVEILVVNEEMEFVVLGRNVLNRFPSMTFQPGLLMINI